MNTKKNIAYAIALAAVSTVCVSCSDDDANGGSSLFEAKSLNITLSMSDGTDGEQSAAKPNRVAGVVSTEDGGLVNNWQGDDCVWAYSYAEEKWNKLTGKADDKGKDVKTFGSTSAFYEEGERMALYYSGDGKIDWDGDESTITLTRPSDDNTLAYVYGTGDEHYTDKGNPFSVKRGSSVASNGFFSAGESSSFNELSVVDAVAKLRIEMPATASTIAAMKKLNYDVTVKLTGSDTESNEFTDIYPSKLTLGLTNKPKAKGNWFKIITSSEVTSGNPLHLTFTPDGEGNKSTEALWNTTEGADDYMAGYVYVPLPAGDYTAVTITVTVTNPNSATGVDNVVGTHTYTWSNGKTVSVGIDATNTINKVYITKALWSFE